MATAVSAASIQSALASVNTRLPADSPLLPLCVTLAADCELTADAFANQWDAFKYTERLKALDSSSLNRFTLHLQDDRSLSLRRAVKKEESRRLDSATAGAYVTNGGSNKRVYTHRDILEDDDLLSGLIGPIHVKREADGLPLDSPARGDRHRRDRNDLHRGSDKEERKEADVFTTPAPPRHRSALLPSTASTASSVSLSPFPPLTPSTAASSLLFTPIASTPTVASTYQSRANPSTITVTFNATLAPPSAPTPADAEERSTRPVDVEVLLSAGELSDLDSAQPFRFMFAKDEAVKDHLCDRLDFMQAALMQTRPYLQLTQRMKEEAAVKPEPTPTPLPSPPKPDEESNDTAMTDAPPLTDKDEKQPTPIKVDPGFGEMDLSDFDEVGLSSTSARSQASVIVAGRVCIDANSDDTKLTLSSVALEGSLSLSGCHRINLRLGTLPSYSLFPGQVLLAKGVNAHGTAMVVEELLTSAPAPRLSLSLSDVARYNTVSSPLVIMAAAGPYTTQEDLLYQPLSDLVARANDLKADVLILQGPFVDIQHLHVRDGRASAYDLTAEFWPELLAALNPHTRVIVQPSTREALHMPVFPQPPLDFPHGRHVTLVSNPATVRVNDVTLGLTTLDVLSHLVTSHSVLMHGVPGKRMPHLASQLVHQQSFYPLFPPVGEEAVDYTHGWRWGMPVRPDVLLLPSALGRFVGEGEKAEGEEEGEGDGGIVVNGGYLTKGNGGGTFAQVTVHPKSEEEMARRDEDGRVRNHLVQSRTRVDIIRI